MQKLKENHETLKITFKSLNMTDRQAHKTMS